MCSHSAANEESKALCENLVKAIAILRPGVTRSESPGSCGYLHAPSSRFAYIYHRKKVRDVKVYFRFPPDVAPTDLPLSLPITCRSNLSDLSNPWAQRFPAFFLLTNPASVPAAAKVLAEVSYPKSMSGVSRSREVVTANDEEEFTEGREQIHLHRRKERNRKAVHRKKERFQAIHGNLFCEVCVFDVADVYGPLGDGFAECHHCVPLGNLTEEHRIRLSELAIVCANCHRMLHRRPTHGVDLYTIDELRRIVLDRHAR
jgi:hypothetical protein